MTKSEKWDDAFNVVAELNIINYLHPKKGHILDCTRTLYALEIWKQTINCKRWTTIMTTGEKMRSCLMACVMMMDIW